ncbi:TRAP transporter substrate-binding protein DctP [Roseomonas sp. CCTCC AB2023176]|uniref:TRAP transporter substrate-binding protein DctP n=1 Tax=Roseomonas sp. CCTCC AB2023176 TaxID=3342640 RepID=UPI0035D62629
MPTRRLALSLALSAAAAGRSQAAEASWTIATEYPATAMPGEGITHFAEAATRLASGALTVRPAYDAPGGLRSAGMLRAVAEGSPEAADAFTGALGGEAPIFQLSALPFLTASTEDTTRLLAVARDAYAATLGARGLALLYATPWPASGIWSRNALADAAALGGLRIRTYDAASTAVMRAAGAAPSQISFADAMPRLRAGELDAVLSSGDGGAGARLWEVLPHFTAIDYASPLSLAFCRTASLDALPASTREAVLQAGRETEARQFRAIESRGTENETRMRANGVTIAGTPAIRNALARAAAPVIAEWETRAGEDGRRVLARYRG